MLWPLLTFLPCFSRYGKWLLVCFSTEDSSSPIWFSIGLVNSVAMVKSKQNDDID